MRKELKLFVFRRKWKKRNTHNYSVPMNVFPIDNVKIGNKTYGQLNVIANNLDYYLKIGHYCSIGENCEFILSGEHPIDRVSTYPFRVKILGERYEALSKGDIIVEDDVWLGFGTIILSGVRIGRGAIVAAGSVVTKDIPPYAIVAGNPAKVIKYRFNEDVINVLKKLDYSKLSTNQVMKNVNDLYNNITYLSVDELRSIVERLNNADNVD